MNHIEIYNKRRKQGQEKLLEGKPLTPSEKTAMEGKWFFTLALPMTVIEDIVKLANQYNVKPSQIVETWIMKGVSK